MRQTLLGCLSWAYSFEFSPGSTDLQKEPAWSSMQRGIAKALEKPHRSLVIQAYVEPGAPEERERAEKRALARAELVRGKLLTHGLPAKRLVTRLGDEETRRALNYDGTLALVLVTFAPADRVREDFEPSSSEYQQWCGTVPRK